MEKIKELMAELPTDDPIEHQHRMVQRRAMPIPQRPRARLLRPDAMRVMEIQAWARSAFPTHDMIKLCRSAAALARQDKAQRRHGGPGNGPKPVRRRWGAYLLQTGATRLTARQRRSLRRRSTYAELMRLSEGERRILWVVL
jgi:hypothetical protein